MQADRGIPQHEHFVSTVATVVVHPAMSSNVKHAEPISIAAVLSVHGGGGRAGMLRRAEIAFHSASYTQVRQVNASLIVIRLAG
jgi:hypothetical protein